MSAYIIAEVTVTNPEQYEALPRMEQPPPCRRTAPKSGARWAGGVAGRRLDARRIVVILKFSTCEAAKAFDSSPEYSKAREARQGAAIMRMIVVEGV